MAHGYVDPNWPNPMHSNDASIIIYGFVPSKVICILAFILFGLALVLHCFQAIKYRTYYFLPLSFGIAMEFAGYIPRYLSATKDPYSITYFVIEYFLIVCAPVLITAAFYACLYKMAQWGTRTATRATKDIWMKPRWILWTFITADVVTTILQVAGAASIGKAESDKKNPTIPNNILLAGLAVQTVSFAVFLVVYCCFIQRLVKDPAAGRKLAGTRPFIIALTVASVLILLRIVFRLAETAQGVFGYLMTHEVFFGTLEFAPVVVAVWILVLWHPGRWILAAPLAREPEYYELRKESRGVPSV